MAAERAARTRGSGATWDDRFVAAADSRGVLSREAAARVAAGRDAAAGVAGPASERGTFLPEDAAVRPARPRGRWDAPRASGVSATANPRGDSATPAGVAPQAGPARHCGRLRLGHRVAPEHVALAAQHGAAALAADAQARGPRTGSAALTADSDTAERARNVGGSRAVHCGAFAGNQPRLTARAATQRAGASSATESSLTSQTGSAQATRTRAGEVATGTKTAKAGTM